VVIALIVAFVPVGGRRYFRGSASAQAPLTARFQADGIEIHTNAASRSIASRTYRNTVDVPTPKPQARSA
jgi:hypothetical protein